MEWGPQICQIYKKTELHITESSRRVLLDFNKIKRNLWSVLGILMSANDNNELYLSLSNNK